MVEGGDRRIEEGYERADREMEGGKDGEYIKQENINDLERKVKKVEMGEKWGQQEEVVREGKGRKKMEDRVKDIGRKMELKKREERKRNILIRRIEVKEGKRREAVEEMLERIEVKVEIKEVKKLRGDKDKGRELG